VSRLGRAAHSFGAFWWDFLVGDSPETAVVVVVVVVAALLLRHHGVIAIVVLPLLAIAGLLVSVHRGRRPRERNES
jgi:hypothetical protein